METRSHPTLLCSQGAATLQGGTKVMLLSIVHSVFDSPNGQMFSMDSPLVDCQWFLWRFEMLFSGFSNSSEWFSEVNFK